MLNLLKVVKVGILKEKVWILKEKVWIVKEKVWIVKEKVGILKEKVCILKEKVWIVIVGVVKVCERGKLVRVWPSVERQSLELERYAGTPV